MAMDFSASERAGQARSADGHIAHVVYGKQPSDSVFRRITPTACILIWAGICVDVLGKLPLRPKG